MDENYVGRVEGALRMVGRVEEAFGMVGRVEGV